MVYCAVFGCKNNNKKTKKPREVVFNFFKFPKDARIRAQWVQRCCRQDVFNADTARICSEHFRSDDYPLKYQLTDYSPKQKLLKPGIVPSLNLPNENVGERNSRDAPMPSRKKRIKKIFSCDRSDTEASDIVWVYRNIFFSFHLSIRWSSYALQVFQHIWFKFAREKKTYDVNLQNSLNLKLWTFSMQNDCVRRQWPWWWMRKGKVSRWKTFNENTHTLFCVNLQRLNYLHIHFADNTKSYTRSKRKLGIWKRRSKSNSVSWSNIRMKWRKLYREHSCRIRTPQLHQLTGAIY